MENSSNTIFFNFSYFALRLLGKGLYSNHWTAISELVANGLDAQADSVKIYINMKDKEHSVIEIFDNGHGMSYDDLALKYVLIGKDKRQDDKIDEEIKKQFMGRKGIGKLAALYLSNKYYLISKTVKEETAWCLDASNVNESEIPHLDRMQIKDIPIEAKEDWNNFKTGTMIKLINVDLTNFGERTLAAFKARLADFYLLNELKGKIEVAVIMQNGVEITFEEVKKSIAFKNMCVFYNNTSNDFSDRLGKSIVIRSSVEEIKYITKSVEILNTDNFQVKGKQKFLKPNGEYTENELEYEMKGWIGLHTSILKEDAILNDSEYLKNKAYRPNQLRLYVRKKLAVENFLEYIKNTQAFGNYIEGEISFDILDDNELGDIATSNRQGFVEDDERVILLIKILKPIIGNLIRSRVNLSHQIKVEEQEYYDKIKRRKEEERKKEQLKRLEAERAMLQAEQERRKAEQARSAALQERERAEKEKLLAEQEQKRAEIAKALALKEREKAEQAKILAEKEKEKAEKANKEIEKKVTVLNNELKIVSNDLGSEKKRNYFLFDVLSQDQTDYAKRLHMIKINVGTIDNVVTKLIMKIQRKKFTIEDAWESLKTISYSTGRIKAVLQYGAVAQFDTKEESTTGDLFQYIYEYVEKILIYYKNINIKVNNKEEIKYIRKFSMQDMAVVLENIVSNSIKHNATLLEISMYKTNSEYAIDFLDNGNGLDNKIVNLDELFQFGKGYTSSGTGVGLYHIHEIVEEMGGYVSINGEVKKGFELQMRYKL